MDKGFLREAIDRIAEMAAPTTVEWQGRMFASQNMIPIPNRDDRIEMIRINTLEALVSMVRNEGIDGPGQPIYIRVTDEKNVRVFSSLYIDDSTFFRRQYYYNAECDVPRVFINSKMDQQTAIIQLQSVYGSTDDRDYLLELLSRMSVNEGVTSDDNGVTQTVTARQGAVLKSELPVQPIVKLQPYRTFLEVDQPVSDFLLRVSNDGGISLYEADGGVWRLEAKRSIAAWLTDKLQDLVDNHQVIITI